MRKVLSYVGFMVIGCAVGLCINWHFGPFLWQVSYWKQSVEVHLLAQVTALDQKTFDAFDKEMGQIQKNKKLEASEVKIQSPEVIRGWISRYVREDMQKYLHAAIKGLPASSQQHVWRNAVLSKYPSLHLKCEVGVAGATDHFSKIWLNPAYMASYEDLRSTMSHELTHYWIQGVSTRGETELVEGITEFLTIKTSESLGWDIPRLITIDKGGEQLSLQANNQFLHVLESMDGQISTYPVQAVSASILLSMSKDSELLLWYLGRGHPEFSPADHINSLLVKRRIAPKEADQWVSEFRGLSTVKTMLEDTSRELEGTREAIDYLSDIARVVNQRSAQMMEVEKTSRCLKKVARFLIERNYKPPSKTVWDAFLETIPDREKSELFLNGVVGIFEEEMFGVLATKSDSEVAHLLRVLLFLRTSPDRSPEETLKMLILDIDLALNAVRIIDLGVIESDDSRITKHGVSVAFDEKIEQRDRLIQQKVNQSRIVWQHHWRLIYLLSDTGYKWKGKMPKFFKGQIELALARRKK